MCKRRIIGKWKSIELGCIMVALVALSGMLGFWGHFHQSISEVSVNVVIETNTMTPFGPSFGIGSGVIVSADGLILTAGHVLRDATFVRVKLHDGRIFDVNDSNAIYVDWKMDIGFIDLPCDTPAYQPMIGPYEIEVGDSVRAIGNPGGLLEDMAIRGKIVDCDFQRLFLGKDVRHFLIDMTIKPGCSGGGLYWRGHLIGIMIRETEELAVVIAICECREALNRYALSQL